MIQVVNCYLRAGGAIPVLEAHGAWADNGTLTASPVIPYPTGLAAGDILFLNVLSLDVLLDDHTVATPTDWALADVRTLTITGYKHYLFWKRATGLESGTLTISRDAPATTDTFGGRMSAFRGCIASGTPYEGLANNSGNNANMNGAAVTTTGPNRNVLHFTTHTNASQGSDCFGTPASGWDELYDTSSLSGTEEGGAGLYAKDATDAGVVAAATHVLDASVRWQVMALALLPA